MWPGNGFNTEHVELGEEKQTLSVKPYIKMHKMSALFLDYSFTWTNELSIFTKANLDWNWRIQLTQFLWLSFSFCALNSSFFSLRTCIQLMHTVFLAPLHLSFSFWWWFSSYILPIAQPIKCEYSKMWPLSIYLQPSQLSPGICHLILTFSNTYLHVYHSVCAPKD